MKKLFLTSIIINIGLVIGVIFSLSLLYDEVFKLEGDCDVTKEHAKLIAEYGKRYHDLPLEERTALDNEFNMIQANFDIKNGNGTQEEFDAEYYKLLDRYDIVEVGYAQDERQELFYRLVHLCSDYS